MARYFFSIRDVLGLIPDEEGGEHADLDAAIVEAGASARDLAKQFIDMNLPLTAVVEVRDVKGRLLASIGLDEAILPRPNGTYH